VVLASLSEAENILSEFYFGFLLTPKLREPPRCLSTLKTDKPLHNCAKDQVEVAVGCWPSFIRQRIVTVAFYAVAL
jgi:hypothetical protein